MRILQVHNFYQQGGGEDGVVFNEGKLLRDKGHVVETFTVSNDDIRSVVEKARAAFQVGYSRSSRAMLHRRILETRPDIVHVHNTFPLLTPSVYDACIALSTPVVQTLHNYRLGCISGVLLRNGKVCEKCWAGSPYWGAVHGCYRGSRTGSFAVAAAVARHRRADTWNQKVTHFIALTEFTRAKFEQMGIEPDRISVKPNFIADPGPAPAVDSPRNGALFVGRLSEEKGLNLLLDAWENVDHPLTIVGDGPLENKVRERAGGKIRYLGRLAPDAVRHEMQRASLLVVPSIWYEPFGMVVVEALSVGLPVMGSCLGGLAELLDCGGVTFEAGSAAHLSQSASRLLADGERLTAYSKAARQEFLRRFTPESNYAVLMKIYRTAINSVSRASIVGSES